ncbi:MAG: hypothetical protein M1839_002272 [Geoglossum umbratile]|nr:MAG: hypothetical protein M1839_002272 [Geoglossum umbratile]
MYTFPPSFSTFQNPLTPQELDFLHSNVHLFAQSVPQPVPGGHIGEIVPASASSNLMTAHNCNCGTDCDCLGCVAHPYNNRTMNFIRSIRDIIGAEAGQNGSRGHIQAHYGGQSPTALSPARSCGNRSIGNPPQETVQSCGCLYNTATELPPQAVAWPPLPSPKESPAAAATPRSPTSLVSQQPWPKIGEGDVENEGEEAISATAYFHVDYPIGGCSEVNGCLCGEGCTCVGCLTHDGHDGVKLAPFTTDLGGSQVTRENDPTKQFDDGDEGAAPFTFVQSAMNGSEF